MNQTIRFGVLALGVTFLLFGSSVAQAKEKGGGGPEGEVPPGWNQGEKEGWGDAGMPPGLAKKDDKPAGKKEKKEKGGHKKKGKKEG